jgi:hypothetical protein
MPSMNPLCHFSEFSTVAGAGGRPELMVVVKQVFTPRPPGIADR